jgi:hypothetical protein
VTISQKVCHTRPFPICVLFSWDGDYPTLTNERECGRCPNLIPRVRYPVHYLGCSFGWELDVTLKMCFCMRLVWRYGLSTSDTVYSTSEYTFVSTFHFCMVFEWDKHILYYICRIISVIIISPFSIKFDQLLLIILYNKQLKQLHLLID